MRGRLAQRAIAAMALLLAAASVIASPPAAAEWPAGTFVVLCYHEIRDDAKQRPDSYTLETGKLALQFAWLRGQGYHVVSMDDVIAARAGTRPLPPRAVVLTFDDGLQSFYTRAFPLLQAFHYPAIVGLVGAWLEESPSGRAGPRYGDLTLSRADFLQAGEIDALRRSGLVEFASHTYGEHEGIIANPQGNLEPAATALAFDAANGRYEDAAAHAERIRADLAQNSERIAAVAGTRPRLVIWPYGAHNRTADRIAAGLGMPYGMSLELGLNTPDIPLSRMRRVLITHDFSTADLARLLQEPMRRAPVRAVDVDLDRLFDADPQRQEANLSKLLDRVQALGVNTVFLQAWSDPSATGSATALYFPNRRLPMRADLFNRVAWQLRTRTGVAVYAGLPLRAFDLPDTDAAQARAAIQDIYDDLSLGAAFQGLVFSGETADLQDVDGFAASLASRVGADHDDLLVARSLPASLAAPDGAAGPAPRSLVSALQSGDYVVLRIAAGATPAGRPAQRALAGLGRAVAALPQGYARTVFEFAPTDGIATAMQMRVLRRAGARNLGLYGDDVPGAGASVEALRPVLSLKSFPGEN